MPRVKPPISALDSGRRRATVKCWRRNNRRRLNRLLTRILGSASPKRRPLAADTRRILVVRLNPRLGNILFLTPMLRSLAAGLPAARIDVVIQKAAQKPLLANLPGVRRVWVQPRSVFGVIGLLRRLRGQRYDLAIDPSENSLNNRLAMALCGARQRLGFASADQWLALSHAGTPAASRHQAIQALALLGEAVSEPCFEYHDALAVFPNASARAAADRRWRRLLGKRAPRDPVVGFFVQATGAKRFAPDWWRRWRAAMQARAPIAVLVQICPPGVGPLDPGPAHIAIARLDELAAFLARLDVFVAADSGPMHLAAAAGVPVVGLFRATHPDAYAPLGPRCVSLAGAGLAAETAADAAQRLLTQSAADRPSARRTMSAR